MRTKQTIMNRVMIRVAISFMRSPSSTWVIFCLNVIVATWSWSNVISPSPQTNEFIVSTVDLWIFLAAACVTSQVSFFMLMVYLMRHQLVMMYFEFQMDQARDLPVRPHLLKYMHDLADKHQVGGQFRGFLSNYGPDEMPTNFVAITQLQSLIEDEEKRNEQGELD
ncbi:hypothetical protein C9426_24045 [Serratia sp. S1B]|nr:hypothetical protein C9426_24045 [Serratia sp. S1B]